jgi:hypothetical protein
VFPADEFRYQHAIPEVDVLAVRAFVLSQRFNGHNTPPCDNLVAGLSPKRGKAQANNPTPKCETDVAKTGWFLRLKSWTEASYDWTKTTIKTTGDRTSKFDGRHC